MIKVSSKKSSIKVTLLRITFENILLVLRKQIISVK